ncbi:MAG: zinc-dependent metalloprotease [Longimicrobiales bacterium]|nr:zinc-dependent metalloprotease [Longimicrobiales bacterium]
MTRPRRRSPALLPGLLLALLLPLMPVVSAPAAAQDADLPTIEARTEGMTRVDGFIPVYFEESTGKLWLEIARFGEEILHYVSLPAGMGQNDLGLNRGDLGPSQVVVFRRVGPTVLMEEPNYRYRAVSDDPLERRSVEDGFPTSVHWGFSVAARTGERVLVDATDFFLRDAHGVVNTLRRSGQGTYRVEKGRSAVHLPRTRGFPRNTEVELTLTFLSDQPGGLVRSVTPTAEALTLRQHHSFVQLPELGSYQPRAFDPRAGYGGIAYYDYATPIGEPLVKRYIRRHRLEKRDPSAAVSEPVEPIIYYLDPGTPEPVRTALLEGGAWWNQAFEAAGYRDAFRVEMLPADADPMDVRYNVIQWVHRSTRGWSYGNSITDPRTGEILKGHVTLGSLRVRQDYLIGEGLTAPYASGDEDPADVLEMSLHRIRQLSAHEIGHTLGLSHNYIASAQRAAGAQSVMDYPHPRIGLGADGLPDLSDPYDTGIGAWDEVAITFGYADFPRGTDEAAALEDVLLGAAERGVTFLTDQDARPAGSAHPEVHLWDNGADVTAELERMMDVRRVALDRFGEAVVRAGRPLAEMEEALVPLYLHHRYQAEAAATLLGGLHYTYALRGDGQQPRRPVPAAAQQAALAALLRTLRPEELRIPDAVLERLPPRPPGSDGSAELFRRWTGLVFDAVAPAAAAADGTLQFVLHPERAARLVQQRALDPGLPGFLDVLERLGATLFDAPAGDAYGEEIQRAVQRVYIARLMGLAEDAPMPQVRALAAFELDRIATRLQQASGGDLRAQAHSFGVRSDIRRFLDRPLGPATIPGGPAMPPGSPIGEPALEWLTPVPGGVLISTDPFGAHAAHREW